MVRGLFTSKSITAKYLSRSKIKPGEVITEGPFYTPVPLYFIGVYTAKLKWSKKQQPAIAPKTYNHPLPPPPRRCTLSVNYTTMFKYHCHHKGIF